MNHKTEIYTAYMLESAPRLGQEVAAIDNEVMAGTWSQYNWQHKTAIMAGLDALRHDVTGDEVRRRFAEAYDAVIDFSTPPGGTNKR
jgi:hypothetical protein